MVAINYATREVTCKIVYYGPGLSGKTTNLIYIHKKVPSNTKGKLISLATEADRTLYFDFLPINIGTISGFAAKFQLYTVPGQVYYNATRKLVLRGVDGLVFVADSQPDKMDENIESLNNMMENLAEYGYDVNSMPVVIQYNKRDLPNVLPVEELESKLNTFGWKSFEASATEGDGIFDTLKMIIKVVLDKTKNSQSSIKSPAKAAAENAKAKSEVAASSVDSPVVSTPPMTETPPVNEEQNDTGPIRQPAYDSEQPAKIAASAAPSAVDNKPAGENDVVAKSAADEMNTAVASPTSANKGTSKPAEQPGANRPFPGTAAATGSGFKRDRRITMSDFQTSSKDSEGAAAAQTDDDNKSNENDLSLPSPTMAPSSRVVKKKRGFFKRLFGIK